MAYQPSNLGYLGFKKQTLKGATTVAVDKFVTYLTESCATEFDEEVFHEGGDGKYDKTSVKTQYREKIGFQAYARPELCAFMLGALYGKSTFAASAATTPNVHTLTVKDLVTTQMQPWMTFERMIRSTTISKVQRIYDCKLSSVTLEGEAGKPCKISVEGTGLSSKIMTTKQTAVYDTDMPYSFYHGTYFTGSGGYTTTEFDVKAFSVKITAENDEAIQTVNLYRRDIINHRVTAEVTMTLLYQDYVEWYKANYASTTTPTSAYSDGSVKIYFAYGTTLDRRNLTLAIPKVRLKPIVVNLDGAVKTLEFPFAGIAMKTNTTTQLVTISTMVRITTSLPI